MTQIVSYLRNPLTQYCIIMPQNQILRFNQRFLSLRRLILPPPIPLHSFLLMQFITNATKEKPGDAPQCFLYRHYSIRKKTFIPISFHIKTML